MFGGGLCPRLRVYTNARVSVLESAPATREQDVRQEGQKRTSRREGARRAKLKAA